MKKGYIISFILGLIVMAGIGVYAINANQINYKSTTVDQALDNLYQRTGVLAPDIEILLTNSVTPPLGNITVSEGLSSYRYIVYSAIQSVQEQYHVRIKPTIISIDDLISQGSMTFNWVGSGTNYSNTIRYVDDTTLNISQNHALLDPQIFLVK